jgi:hypothetical protein
MATRDVVSTRFRIALGRQLKIRFGKVLSAQRFSDLYNLNAHGSSTISRETARLWIRGKVLPDYGHLAVLVQWLELDPEDFLGHENPATTVKNEKLRPISTEGRDHVTRDLLALWDELDPDTRRTVLVVAKTLSAQRPVRRGGNDGALDIHRLATSKFKLPTENYQTGEATYLE